MSAVYEYERYMTTPDNLKETLEEYGVAIIPNVLNDQEISEMAQGMWDTLEDWTQHWDTPINRLNPDSWRNIKDLFPKHSMLIQQYGLEVMHNLFGIYDKTLNVLESSLNYGTVLHKTYL